MSAATQAPPATATQSLSGAEVVLRALKDNGVEVIFGYPGGAVLPIYDAIFQQNAIRHILVRHEQAAVHAAEGYARSTGKVGVVLVTSGPGATNAVAFLDPFGNLVTAAADQELVNPLSTAFALCSRQYAQTRYGLVDDPENSALARATLTNPTYGTFVFLRAPDPNTSVGLFDIGAYGSTMGSQPSPYIPSAFQYYELPPGVSELQLQQAMVTLPPLYSAGIKIMPQRVVD